MPHLRTNIIRATGVSHSEIDEYPLGPEPVWDATADDEFGLKYNNYSLISSKNYDSRALPAYCRGSLCEKAAHWKQNRSVAFTTTFIRRRYVSHELQC